MEFQHDYEWLTDITNASFDTLSDFEPISRFLHKYAIHLYGKNKVQQWSKVNKGKSLVYICTSSDIAYILLILENQMATWDQLFELRDISKEEKAKYMAKNRHLLNNEEKEKYMKVEPKFTSRKGQKRLYLKHGFRKAGLQFFAKQHSEWRKFMGNQELFNKLDMSFTEYSSQVDVARHWASTPEDVMQEEPEDDYEYEDGNYFSTPGDDGFVGDRGVSGDNDEDEGDDDEQIENEVLMRKKGKFTSKEMHTYVDRGLYKDGNVESDDDDGGSDAHNKQVRNSKSKKRKVSQSPEKSFHSESSEGSDEEEDPFPKQTKKGAQKK